MFLRLVQALRGISLDVILTKRLQCYYFGFFEDVLFSKLQITETKQFVCLAEPQLRMAKACFLFFSLEKGFNTKLMCHPLESHFLLYWLVIWKLNFCSHIQYQTTPNICFRYVLKPPNLRAAQIFAWFYLFILKITSSLRIKKIVPFFFLLLFLVLKWDIIRWLRTVTWKHRNKYHKILHNCVCKL